MSPPVRIVRGVPGLTDPADVTSQRHHLARRVNRPRRTDVDEARDHGTRALTALVSASQAEELGGHADPVDLYDALIATNAQRAALMRALRLADVPTPLPPPGDTL